MIFIRHILSILMLLATGFAAAQVSTQEVAGKNVAVNLLAEVSSKSAADWLSYRDAYKAMLWFEKYGKPKNLIQNHYQVSAKDKNASIETLRLSLVSKSTRLNLPLDATGRTVLPLLKAAYDDNAELILNQKANQYQFRARVSILIRPDGIYEAADLRAACEQLLAYQNTLGNDGLRGKKCSGVRFVYAKKSLDTLVELRIAERNAQVLPVTEGAAFWDENNENFKTVNYVFSSGLEKMQLVTRSAPIAISAQFN
ncbi:MAG: hypothetical protein V4447_16445 [Pseudomonadota bacterium]